jgi:linoleoyl-CoA desaturase
LGAHAEAWKHKHIHSHHFAPNVKHYDSDLKITSLIRVEPTCTPRWYHQYQPYYAPFAYTTYSLFWVFIKDFVIYFFDKEYPKSKSLAYHLSFWIQKTFYLTYLLILPLLFSYQTWKIVLIGFLGMHLIQSLFLLFTFFMTHHVEGLEYPATDDAGNIQASWFRNQVLSSNDFYPFSPFANFIFGGFNNHIAHHLFPHIHHVHYPKLNRMLYKTLIEHGLQPKSTTYWGGVISHLRHLSALSQTSERT